MANILLTNICNQKCPYCFAEDVMLETKSKKEMTFKNFKTVLDFLEKSKEKWVRLMGGEPTLHSQFEKFVDYALSRKFQVHIFTNGIFSKNILNFLADKKDLIKYSFNINQKKFYTSTTRTQVESNLKTLSIFKKCLIGMVLWQKDFNTDYLIDLAKTNNIKIIMLRLANPQNHYSVSIEKILRETEKITQRKLRVGFGCGMPKDMFTQNQIQTLNNIDVINLKWGCDANSGRFDIDTDLTIFRCFPLAIWNKKKLLDFKNSKEVEDYFVKLAQNNLLEPCFLLKK